MRLHSHTIAYTPTPHHRSWCTSARYYLEEGDAFVSECLAVLAMSRNRLATVDAARRNLEEQDRTYNDALDRLEVRMQVRAHVRKPEP
eukprot:67506-Chlamydomonas_euryale.AAC.1